MAVPLLERYSPTRHRPLDHLLEDEFLHAHSNASSEMKIALSRLFWAYAQDREDDYGSIRAHWFELNSLSPEKLKDWKKDFLRPEREQIEKMLTLSYSEYSKAIWNLSSATRDDKMRTQRLLNYLLAQMEITPLSEEVIREFWYDWDYWYRVLIGKHDDKFVYFRKYLLTRPEQWQKAQQLRGKL